MRKMIPDNKQDNQFVVDFTIHFTDLIFSKSDLLGGGGYSTVYKGRWDSNDVAIKLYNPQDFTDITKDKIKKEAEIMATVGAQSDFLVRLKGVVLEKPHYSLVMEYLPGGDLFQLLRSSEKLTWTRRYRIALDMTIGLRHLHKRKVLHRDLKSLNILLDSNGRAKLADFGLSTLKTNSASTTASGFKGTVLWSAPELFKPGTQATTASDIYSLAMVLWELASRKTPFEDASDLMIAATWVAQGKQETIPEGTPEEFKTLILEGWHKDPAQRPKAIDVFKRLTVLWEAEQKKASAVAALASPLDSASAATAAASTSSVSSSTSSSSLVYGLESGQPLLKSPMEEKWLQLKQELEKQQEETVRLSKELEKLLKIQRPEVEKEKTPLSMNIYTSMSAPKGVVKPVDEKAFSQLLKQVASGEQDKAEALIKEKLGKGENLLMVAGTVTDLSDREFKQITPFQYALWALDWHMWEMIRKYLPEEEQVKQWSAWNSKEVKDLPHGKHFSLHALTNQLEMYVNNVARTWRYGKEAHRHWQTEVGKAQAALPAHVVNEYCRLDRSFYPIPTFTEDTLPRTRTFYDEERDWFTGKYNDGRLGEKFGVVRTGKGAAGVEFAERESVVYDLAAIKALSETRTKQLDLLATQLKRPQLSPSL